MQSSEPFKCVNCGYPVDHPFGIVIDNGVCSGCKTHQEKYEPIWEARYEQLKVEVRKYAKGKRSYDCVIPVVGDAEDYFLVKQVLRLGLSPLVVSVNDYFKNDIGWHNFHQLITYFDVDSIVFNPDFVQYQELVRTSLRKYDHILLPFHQLHTSFPVHIAKERRIPLVLWPQLQALEQVGKFSHKDSAEMSRWSRREHDLFGCEIQELIGNGSQVNELHLNYYNYPSVKQLSGKVKGIYLSNYLPWDPMLQNSSAVDFGFHPEENSKTFDPYERAGSSVYYEFHDLLKLKRCNYRKIDDHVAREIRHERLSTIEGNRIKELSKNIRYNIRPFFEWLNTTSSGYEWYLKHRLGKYEDIISGEMANVDLLSELSDRLLNMLPGELHKKSIDFVMFGKGI